MQCSAFLQYIVAPIVLLTVWAGAVGSVFTCQSVIDLQKSVSQRTLEQNSLQQHSCPGPDIFATTLQRQLLAPKLMVGKLISHRKTRTYWHQVHTCKVHTAGMTAVAHHDMVLCCLMTIAAHHDMLL